MALLTPGFGFFIWAAIAFVVVLVILKKFAWKPIIAALDEREKTIADAIESAERVKAEMAQLKSENELLLQKAREERALILKEAKEAKDRIVLEAKEQAKVEANKIMVDAQAAIHSQKMAALTEVKNQVGKMVIEVSEKVLRRELADKNQQESYIRQLAEDVQLN